MNILFLCTGNSCPSILAEATFNAIGPESMHAMSAGGLSSGFVHPKSIALLTSRGITTDGYYSKSWDNLPNTLNTVTPDIVITVCGNAAGETCPAYLGKVIGAHWALKILQKSHAPMQKLMLLLRLRTFCCVNGLKRF